MYVNIRYQLIVAEIACGKRSKGKKMLQSGQNRCIICNILSSKYLTT